MPYDIDDYLNDIVGWPDTEGIENFCNLCGEDCAEDVDCESCGIKFWIRSCQYGEGKKPWPTQCPRCQKGLPPTYEY